MSNNRHFLKLVFILITLSAFKTDCPDVRFGTKTVYRYKENNYSAPPKDFNPVFINYTGRHGARHLTSLDADSSLFELLKLARTENSLT